MQSRYASQDSNATSQADNLSMWLSKLRLRGQPVQRPPPAQPRAPVPPMEPARPALVPRPLPPRGAACLCEDCLMKSVFVQWRPRILAQMRCCATWWPRAAQCMSQPAPAISADITLTRQGLRRSSQKAAQGQVSNLWVIMSVDDGMRASGRMIPPRSAAAALTAMCCS